MAGVVRDCVRGSDGDDTGLLGGTTSREDAVGDSEVVALVVNDEVGFLKEGAAKSVLCVVLGPA